MTLIRTLMAPYGIIQAADANLTSGDVAAGGGPKVFDLGFANGAVALAGSYEVGGEEMRTWMPSFISTYAATAAPTLAGFAQELKANLERQIGASDGCLYHVAGYVQQGADWHPEMHFVRNIAHIDPLTGAYHGVGAWEVSEDFWTRDLLTPEGKGAWANGAFFAYINGTPEGRIAFNMLDPMLGQFIHAVRSMNPTWQFRTPRSLDELAAIVDAEFRFIGAMYRSSDYPAPYIGGEPLILTIPTPPDAVTVWRLPSQV